MVAVKKKILVVDDEQAIILYLQTLLEDNGYSVVSADNANEGLILARKEQPDLICIDVMMPKRSGISLYVDIRADMAIKHIPLVVISGVESAYSFKGSRFRKIIPDKTIPEPDRFFEKPIDMGAFLHFLEQHFRGRLEKGGQE